MVEEMAVALDRRVQQRPKPKGTKGTRGRALLSSCTFGEDTDDLVSLDVSDGWNRVLRESIT